MVRRIDKKIQQSCIRRKIGSDIDRIMRKIFAICCKHAFQAKFREFSTVFQRQVVFFYMILRMI